MDVPIYCATKAAAHSFTTSLRELERKRAAAPAAAAADADADAGAPAPPGAAVRVVEVVPPAVNTDLGGPGLHDFGAPLDAFADSVMKVGSAARRSGLGACWRRAGV